MLEMSSHQKIRNGIFSETLLPTLKGAARTSTAHFVTSDKRILTGLGRSYSSFLFDSGLGTTMSPKRCSPTGASAMGTTARKASEGKWLVGGWWKRGGCQKLCRWGAPAKPTNPKHFRELPTSTPKSLPSLCQSTSTRPKCPRHAKNHHFRAGACSGACCFLE